MSTIRHDDSQHAATLSAAEREWLRRQGRAARSLEARQRQSARNRRFAPQRPTADPSRRSKTPPA